MVKPIFGRDYQYIGGLFLPLLSRVSPGVWRSASASWRFASLDLLHLSQAGDASKQERASQYRLQQAVDLCHRCQIGPAHNQGDIAICIINNGTEVIGGRAVSPCQNHIAKFGRIYMMAGACMILPEKRGAALTAAIACGYPDARPGAYRWPLSRGW